MIFESPIEAKFWEALRRAVDPAVRIRTQVEATTPWGTFRYDFMLDAGRAPVIVECDGAEYHNARRDEWRDAATIGEGVADAVYRFPGWALEYHPEDCLFFLAQREEWLFGQRGLNIINAEASNEIAHLVALWGPDAEAQVAAYRDLPSFAGHFFRRSTDGRQFWRTLHAFLRGRPGLSLDAAMDAFTEGRP